MYTQQPLAYIFQTLFQHEVFIITPTLNAGSRSTSWHVSHGHWTISKLLSLLIVKWSWYRVETDRNVTDRCKHCGRLRYHVPTFFRRPGEKWSTACSASLKLVIIRSSSNQMHASSNLPSKRTKKVGTLVTSIEL
jgi:hypothetical protein